MTATPDHGRVQANGNEPEGRQKLAAALRDPLAVMPAGAEGRPETYDLAERGLDTVQAMRDLAAYSSKVADNLETILATYNSQMRRLLGKIGK
jgi:hypothetical protein